MGKTYHPLDILENQFLDSLWKTMVSCVLLNRTRRVQVEAVIYELFRLWPSAYHMSLAEPSAVSDVIRSLGFQNRRARALVRMASDFLSLPETPTPAELGRVHAVGVYALEAHRILFLHETDFEPTDVVLSAYLKALKGETREQAA